MLKLCSHVARQMAGPSFLRHPLFRLLFGLFMMAIVLQYSGIFLLRQRYTMPRFSDVMHLVFNQNATRSSSNRRILLEDMTVRHRDARGDLGAGGRDPADLDVGQPKQIISRYLQQPKQELTNDVGDGEIHNLETEVLAPPHLPNNTQTQSSPYLSSNRRTNDFRHEQGGISSQHQEVPVKPNSQEQMTQNREIPIGQELNNGDYSPLSHRGDDEAVDGGGDSDLSPGVGLPLEVTPSEPPRLDIRLAPTKVSMMAPMWNFINKIKNRLLSQHVTTTPKPLPPCPKHPSNLDGPVSVIFSSPEWEALEKAHPEVLLGGHWEPSNCTARHRVALVIPFRDRDTHLRIFLQHIHPFLQHQFIDYTIYVVEQTARTDFNRAMLMNVGFVEAEKLRHHDCFVFHDVDLLPEIAQNMYSCPHLPRHMSAAVDSLGYRLPYQGIFGGVSALRTEHFRLVNGFSNCFFGWGGEDDDMYNRIRYHGLDITRYPLHIARYRMMTHKKEMPSNDRFTMLDTGKLRYATDGITSLVYEIKAIERRPLYTLIRVHLDKDEVIRKSINLSMLPLEEVADGADDSSNDNVNKEVDKVSSEQVANEVATHNEYSPYKRVPRTRDRRHDGEGGSTSMDVGRGGDLDVTGRLDRLLHINQVLVQEVNHAKQVENDHVASNSQRMSSPPTVPDSGLSSPTHSSSKERLMGPVGEQPLVS